MKFCLDVIDGALTTYVIGHKTHLIKLFYGDNNSQRKVILKIGISAISITISNIDDYSRMSVGTVE